MNIEVKNLTKSYGSQIAVDDVSFKVEPGEIVGFLGPNGAGKTTTMKAITCFLQPDKGNIIVGGKSICKNPEAIKQHIGYLSEHNPLYDEMNVIDFLKFVAKLYNIPKSLIKERILKMIRVCGLEAEKHKRINELSKGYQQRVGLAQALIHEPQILILDEPTTGLDPNQIVEIRELIKDIGKTRTVILSSHILDEVEATCDRIIIINKGRIVIDEKTSDLRKHTSGNEVLRVGIQGADVDTIFEYLIDIETIETIDFLDIEKQIFKVQSSEGESSIKPIFDFCVKNNYYLTELTPIEAKLEEIFRQLTVR